jgi:hypothetical protein
VPFSNAADLGRGQDPEVSVDCLVLKPFSLVIKKLELT